MKENVAFFQAQNMGFPQASARPPQAGSPRRHGTQRKIHSEWVDESPAQAHSSQGSTREGEVLRILPFPVTQWALTEGNAEDAISPAPAFFQSNGGGPAASAPPLHSSSAPPLHSSYARAPVRGLKLSIKHDRVALSPDASPPSSNGSETSKRGGFSSSLSALQGHEAGKGAWDTESVESGGQTLDPDGFVAPRRLVLLPRKGKGSPAKVPVESPKGNVPPFVENVRIRKNRSPDSIISEPERGHQRISYTEGGHSGLCWGTPTLH